MASGGIRHNTVMMLQMCFMLLLVPLLGFAQYSVSVLPLPSGAWPEAMSGINSSGHVAGGDGYSGHPFLGSPSGSVLIPMPPGFSYGSGSALNDSGQVAGGGYLGSNNGAFIASVSGSAAIPMPSGSSFSVDAINASGQVAGTIFGNSQSVGYIATTEGYSQIPLPNGVSSAFVYGLNDLGQATGSINLNGYGWPFVGTTAQSTITPLPWLGGGAWAINDSGEIAGSGFPQGTEQAFVATAGGVTVIPLPEGATTASIQWQCFNNAGQVVGQSDAGGWIWDSVNGTRLLNNLVPAGWNISNAMSISNTGLILANATYNGGLPMYVELTPLPTSGCIYSVTPPAAYFGGNAAGGTISLTTQPGCAWTASSNTPWLEIGSATTGSGSGTVSYQMSSNTSYPNRVGVLTIGGRTFPVSQGAVGLGSPIEPVGVVPSAGSGLTETFAYTFTDEAGAGDLKVLDGLINNYLDGRQACYFALVPSGNSGYIYLVDDAGDGGYVSGTPMLLSSNATLQNSQCSISAAGSSVSTVGNNLRLILTISFRPGFAGNKIFYIAARSNSQNSGWQALGTWNVPGASVSGPSVSPFAPGQITAATNEATYDNFSFSFSDPNGYADIGVVDILINSFLDGVAACYVAYVPTSATTGYLYLVDDAGDGGYVSGTPTPLGSSGTVLYNSQCEANGISTTASASGNTLILNLQVSFMNTFLGNRVVYAATRGKGGGNSGWQAVESVIIP